MYAVVYDNRILVGPMNWNRAMFQGALEKKGINQLLSRVAPDDLPMIINEHAKIMQVEENRPELNPLVPLLVYPSSKPGPTRILSNGFTILFFVAGFTRD